MSAADPPRDVGARPGAVPSVSVPDVRDYARINAELASLLDAGHRHVRLAGADGQRLLARGLRGSWEAVVEIQGDAGPELAADLDAPGLIVVCTGSALDGAARGLRRGRLLILGRAGSATAATQSGGTVVVAGATGHRTGLNQTGGRLLVGGEVGRLAGERQRGGLLIVFRGPIGPNAGHGRSGGRFARPEEIGEEDRAVLRDEARAFGAWWPPALRVAETLGQGGGG